MRFRTIIAAVAAPLALGGVLLTSTAASAATGPQQYVTHAQMHPDTTSYPTSSGIVNWDNSPVWAWDNVTLKFTPTPISPALPDGDNWLVKVEVVGSFQGFADPNSGADLISTGDIHGTISYTLHSDGVPQALPAQQPQGVVDYSQSPAMVINSTSLSPGAPAGSMLQQLFTQPVSSVEGGGVYDFSYQHGNYIQNTAGNFGFIRGHGPAA
jgi:hypothetical protein